MNIEDLIRNRKDQLAIEKAPPEAWEQIQKNWKKPNRNTPLLWKVAAIIFIMLSIGLLVQNRLLETEVAELASLSDISDQYSIIESNYVTQINMMESNLPLDELKTQQDFSWMFEELDLLEEVNNMYRTDIGKVNSEQLVQVLIDYYEKKIKLLKKLELEFERKSKQNKNEETSNNTISI